MYELKKTRIQRLRRLWPYSPNSAELRKDIDSIEKDLELLRSLAEIAKDRPDARIGFLSVTPYLLEVLEHSE